MRFTFNKSLLVASVLLAISSQSAFATNGMAPIGLGITQKAMGGAAVATSENTMNAGTNPASLSNVDAGWDIGAEVFMPDRGATITGSGFSDGSFSGNEKDTFLIPEGGYKRQLNDKNSVGVVVYGNGGMNSSYDKAIPIFGSTKAGINLEQLVVAPTWSTKINENNSVGVSLNLAYQRFSANGLQNFTAPVGNPQQASSSPNDVTDKGNDASTGVGATIGWQGKLSPTVTAGVAYRSKTNMGKLDKYKGLFAEQGDLDMPAATTVGIAWQATPKTLIATDIQKIEYSKVKAMANLNPGTNLLGTDGGSGFGWKDQTVYKIGVKHQVNSKFAALAGYNHAKNPLQSSQTLFNVLAPATVEDHVTLGGEWKLNDKASLTAAYTHAFDKGVNGSNSIGTGGEANLNMEQNAVGIAYSVKF
ncbi:MAG: hypothetical protein BWK73_35275 [Thiothrix lacustris]|uniref:Long-chain fatty acid transporter n=1 Tax=Thiothrix lacustris TaxID=525917 RepID=A0A1Y1QG02_9GAMM|nr:MAG: hypothetical protein BWK73_35275 [Thiothrix lacustris]